MSASTARIAIALFLIAHGFIHFSLTTVPVPAPDALRTPFWPGWWRNAIDPLWLASRVGLSDNMVRILGSMLWVTVLAGFTLAGLGLMGVPGLNSLWQSAAIFGTIASLLLLVFYWHPWLVMGVLINLVVLASIWGRWPVALFPAR